MKRSTCWRRTAGALRVSRRHGPARPTSARFESPLPGETVPATVLRTGNPQCVVLGPLPDDGALQRPRAAHCRPIPMFPAGTNVEFAQVEAPDRIRILIWERGVGPTSSSGTGSTAVGRGGGRAWRRRAVGRRDGAGRHSARRLAGRRSLSDRLGRTGLDGQWLGGEGAMMRTFHDAPSKPSRRTRPLRRRSTPSGGPSACLLGPLVCLALLLAPLPLAGAGPPGGGDPGDDGRLLGHRSAAAGRHGAARPGAGRPLSRRAGARPRLPRSPIRSSSSSSAASSWPRRCSSTASIAASPTPRCRGGSSAPARRASC